MPPIEAPAVQDQPTLDQLLQGVPRSLSPELLDFARTRDLRLEDEEGEAAEEGTLESETDGEDQSDTGPESFTDFDPSQIPEDADRDWLAQRYEQMNRDYTQKTQGLAEGRRTAEESQALIEGLRDPQTRPHYLRLLGVDLSDPTTLDALGFELADDEDLDLDEPDPNERVSQLEQQLAQDREEREAAAELQALDEIADRGLETIEGQWGRKLTEDEDMFLRREAENNPGPDGLPDYASASKKLKGILNRGVEQELKRREEAGRGLAGGKPGGKALDPANDEDRLALGAQAAERAMASQS